ncbi:MAG: NAD(P)H-hydrate epimerase [archaeon]
MISVKDMYEIDKDAQKRGIPAIILMENAGANAARIVHEKLGSLKDKNILIFCGTGNNGGDGLVFARHAKKYGANVAILLAKPPENIRTEETKTNYNIVKNQKISIYTGKPPKNILKTTDIAIDAMLGIGLEDKVKDPYKTMIETFNDMHCTKISLDCPSGIDPDTGNALGTAVKPDITITFHDIKKGMTESNSGQIIITDIGIKKGAGQHGNG